MHYLVVRLMDNLFTRLITLVSIYDTVYYSAVGKSILEINFDVKLIKFCGIIF